ncbi:MAG: hypothetical protein ACR2OR_06920 [Hyphomicrobiales bacterium]
MSIPTDENQFMARAGGMRLFGAGAFLTAQLGAFSSSRKLNNLATSNHYEPVAGDAREKLLTFGRVSDQHMSNGKMLFGAPFLKAALKSGRKKVRVSSSGLELAREALEATRELAECAGAGLFLISGSLLGPVREGELLAHDYDLDFGVFSDDRGMAKLVQFLGADACFELTKVFNVTPELSLYNSFLKDLVGRPLKYTICYRGTVTIDIFVHIAHEGTVYHGTDRNVWLNSPFGISTFDFSGKSYLVPDNYERYLEENYGNWHEPVRDYHCATDTPNSGTVVSYRAFVHAAKNYSYFRQTGDLRWAGLIHGQIQTMQRAI